MVTVEHFSLNESFVKEEINPDKIDERWVMLCTTLSALDDVVCDGSVAKDRFPERINK